MKKVSGADQHGNRAGQTGPHQSKGVMEDLVDQLAALDSNPSSVV
jgi:hypothetical protein